jgi:alginate O-acetyltransferase complex protein AlgI
MLFSSYSFLFVFLPLAWLGWRVSVRFGGVRWAAGWLTVASLVFYSWWDWRYTPVLVGSLVVNYLVGRRLAAAPGRNRGWLVFGLAWNIGLLGFFKYWNFLAGNINTLSADLLPLSRFVLPLGISFFTFQKIAFLVDAWKGRIERVAPGEFALFVLFFPQLIAGPIVHHGEFIPQLRDPAFSRPAARGMALGLTVFAAGLFQKCVVADTLAPLADAAFGLASNGTMLRMQEAWVGLVAYALQLFYDFSGYSHMALGLALLFGLRLPVNFLAPYTAGSLIEFWRRWHMTLSAFLRDYVYFPLGGNRAGPSRHLVNLLLTMLIGGIWHGAGWTFVLWGLWHGAALCLNHLWRARPGVAAVRAGQTAPAWAHMLTVLTILLGWVLFRAPDLATARVFAESLFGLHGISVPIAWAAWVEALAPVVRPRGIFPNLPATASALVVLAGAGWLACRGPRLLQFLGVTPDDVTRGPAWQDAELAPAGQPLQWSRAVVAGICFALAVALLSRSSPFLYFQF